MTDAALLAPSSADEATPTSHAGTTAKAHSFSPSVEASEILAGLRVGFVTNYFPVLSEAFVAYAAAGLVKCGTDLSILPLYQKVAQDPEHAAIGILADNDLRHRVIAPRFGDEGFNRLLHTPAVVLRDLLSGSPIVPRLFDRRLRALYEREAFKTLPDFDILHCQFGTLAEPILRHRRDGTLKGKLIVHFRGFDISKFVKLYGPDYFKEVFECADRFLTNCDHFKKKLVSLGCPEELIDVAPSGLDLSAFPFEQRSNISVDPLRLLTIGRLTEKKGIADGISTLAILRENGLNVRYRIIGEGHLRPTLEAQIESLGLSDYVDMPGAKRHDEIKSEFDQADIFLAPSVTSEEGDQDAPVNTLKEAMALGVPVVATEHGGIPELVHNGLNGWLAPEYNPQALAHQIMKYLDDPGLVRRFTPAARKEVEDRWSLEYATWVYADAYRKALAAPARDPKLKTSS